MQTSLRPEYRDFIEDQVRRGRYRSEAEVVEAGLQRLMVELTDDELTEDDISALQESEAQIARGEGQNWADVAASFRKKYLGG